MVAKAHAKYLRISPRKVKIVADLIRGKSLEQATAILLTTPKAASEPLLKLLKSAAANAENNHKMDPENLYVSEVFATPGPIIKRIMPRAGAVPIASLREPLTSRWPWRRRNKGGGRIWDRKSIPRPARGRY